MQVVRVWAPRADHVEVVVGATRTSLVREEPWGWWGTLELAENVRYAISLDGGPPRPDPRSRSQPDGVHEASRAYMVGPRETDAFVPVPLDRAILYELHVGTFTAQGTFAAAISQLDHLVDLGVTHVELMPIAQFPGSFGWGYDGVNLFAAHAAYGGPEGLHELARACHQRGLAVIVDVVHNHLGPEGNYLDLFGPFHTKTHATPWGAALNFDAAQAHEVRRYFIDSALAWLADYEIDGLRLDAVHAIVDSSRHHFVAELSDAVRELGAKLGRTFQIIGEYDAHDPTVLRATAEGGMGLDAHWNDDFHHAVHVLLTGEQRGYLQDFVGPTVLADVLQAGYYLDGKSSRFRGGPHGQPFGDLSRDRLVAYTQSHDQIGNRARGERLVHLAGADRAKIAAAILLTSPFVPMLFQGEEWAASTPFLFFADYGDPDLRDAVRAGRQREHGELDQIDPMAPSTRDHCVLRWSERARAVHAAMLTWYRSLIALRREHPALRNPDASSTRARWQGGVLVIRRGEFTVAANLGEQPATVEVGEILLSSKPIDRGALPPLGCVIARSQPAR